MILFNGPGKSILNADGLRAILTMQRNTGYKHGNSNTGFNFVLSAYTRDKKMTVLTRHPTYELFPRITIPGIRAVGNKKMKFHGNLYTFICVMLVAIGKIPGRDEALGEARRGNTTSGFILF